VTGFLKVIGVFNAAIWLGSAIFFTFAVGPAFFSNDMKALLGTAYPVYSGAIAQVVIERYFLLHHWCGGIALVHLVAEWLYTGRPVHQVTLWVVGGAFGLGLIGGLALQPHLKKLHLTKYAVESTPLQKEQAAASFRVWHGVSQTVNLIVLFGLVYYLWQAANPATPPRFGAGGSKFRG
jgi:hypothetical protein